MDKNVKEKIKTILSNKKMTQNDLAEIIGVNKSTMRGFFSHSANKILTLDLVIKIGEALNVSPLWLAYGKGIYRLDEALQALGGKPLISDMNNEKVAYFTVILADYFNTHPYKKVVSLTFIDDNGDVDVVKIDREKSQIIEEKREIHQS